MIARNDACLFQLAQPQPAGLSRDRFTCLEMADDRDRARTALDEIVEFAILPAALIRSGPHITAMGSDAEHKNEVDPALIARVRSVADRLAQTRGLGELHHAIAAGLVAAAATFPEPRPTTSPLPT